MTATQLPLFAADQPLARRVGMATRRSTRRDPAELEATARGARLGQDLHSAFVSFWARLSPEQRAELRSRLAA